MKVFQKISACCYRYKDSNYCVERMAGGLWDAYLPLDADFAVRIWQSVGYKTRKAAASAISMRRRELSEHAGGYVSEKLRSERLAKGNNK